MNKEQQITKIFGIILKHYDVCCRIDKNGNIELSTPSSREGVGESIYNAVIRLANNLEGMSNVEKEEIRKIING